MDLETLLSRYPAPFDPEKNEPVDLPDNQFATEYLATSQTPDGEWILHPQIWFDQNGEPMFLGGEDGVDAALFYEAMTGERFPRFSSPEEADTFAQQRSKAGGASHQGITGLKR